MPPCPAVLAVRELEDKEYDKEEMGAKQLLLPMLSDSFWKSLVRWE